MPIYRALYVRENKPKGMTFFKRNAALAAEYAYTILQPIITRIGGGPILTITELPSRNKKQSLS